MFPTSLGVVLRFLQCELFLRYVCYINQDAKRASVIILFSLSTGSDHLDHLPLSSLSTNNVRLVVVMFHLRG